MEDDRYIEWKNWNEINFGVTNPGSNFYFQQIFKHSANKGRGKVLEIGFGNGELLGYFRSNGFEVYGVEINSILVNRAKDNGYKAFKGWVCNINELSSIKFDMVVAFDVAEHLTENQLRELFSWVDSNLDEEGSFFLRFPEGSSPFGLSNQNGDFTHLTSLTELKILSLCESSSLKLLSYSDDIISSNKLCNFGFIGKGVLLIMQLYSRVVKASLRIIFFPVSTSVNLATNSIVVVKKSLKNLTESN